MWGVLIILVLLAIFTLAQYKHKQKLLSLVELFRIQNSSCPSKASVIDEISIGYIYGMARSLSANISASKKIFLELASFIYGSGKANQAMLSLLEYSTQEDSKKKLFIKAANTAMEDVANMSALLSSHDPLSLHSQTKMPDGLSRLYKEQKKK